MARAALLALVANWLSAQPVAFRSPVTAATGSVGASASVLGVAIADFNRDNRLDFVYVNSGVPGWEIVLGNGDGTFRPGVDLPTPPARAPFAADLNGDSRPDLITSCDGPYRNGVGDGTFRNASLTGLTAPAGVPLFVADVNGDSRPDLLCGGAVFLNQGNGNFARGVFFTGAPTLLVLAVTDLNRDSRVDILFRTESAALFVARGQGDGSFFEPQAITVPFSLGDGVVAGDFNGDGAADLAGLTAGAPELVVLLNSGNATFPQSVRTRLPALPGAYTLRTAGDLNGDRRVDLVTADFLLPGNGDGTVGFPLPFGGTSERCVVPVLRSPTECALRRELAVLADFNNDGRLDILNADSAVTPRTGTARGERVIVSLLLNSSGTAGLTVTGVNSASADIPIAPGSIVTAYGVSLAPRTEAASGANLPSSLAGIRLRLWDRRNGESYAPLLFVSPTQINFLNTSTESQVLLSIEPVEGFFVPPPSALAIVTTPSAPAFYNVNGLALGNALTIAPDGTRSAQTLVTCGAAQCDPVPVDVTAGDVIVSLYGTGFDTPDLATAVCLANGRPLPVLYAGPQREVRGLNQVNLRLPVTLAGAGTVTVNCSFRALPPPPFTIPSPAADANAVRLRIQ